MREENTIYYERDKKGDILNTPRNRRTAIAERNFVLTKITLIFGEILLKNLKSTEKGY